uniref:Putative salivary secreted peptide n=2 Tax=Ixodes ricinus TaxID=34613 RepID=V5ID10_IXORI
MFVAFLFIPVVAGNVFMEDSLPNIPEITERQSVWTRDYTIFDPCNTNKPGNRSVSCSQLKRQGHNDNKVYEIYILGNPVKVKCDMDSDGGGWTVIQSRSENRKGCRFTLKETDTE